MSILPMPPGHSPSGAFPYSGSLPWGKMDYKKAIRILKNNFKLIAGAKGSCAQIDKNDLHDIAYNNPGAPLALKNACKFFLDNPAYFNLVENSEKGPDFFHLDQKDALDAFEVEGAVDDIEGGHHHHHHHSHRPKLTKNDNGSYTTPGGYKIIPSKKNNQGWTIVSPEGKTTNVSGDPHVAEGDGGTWDFKRDSVFKLPDGTRIDVRTTAANKNGWTTTKQLDITCGNDHATISDIDKGPGKSSDIKHDGREYRAENRGFGGNDVFQMAGDGDDWILGGKEIVGSKDRGSKLVVGQDLKPIDDKTHYRQEDSIRWTESLYHLMLKFGELDKKLHSIPR